MPRPMFGYRVVNRVPVIDPDAAAIIRAVVAAPVGRRYRAALRPGETMKTAKNRARSIMRHRERYTAGIAREDFAPDDSLRILDFVHAHAG